jgi:SAM-dependent methyltransferase
MTAVEEPALATQKEYWKYWNSRADYPHERARRRGDKILACLRSLRLERPAILDLGCGMGWLANELAAHGPTTGVDLSEDAIAVARQKFPRVTFHAGSALEMELPEGRFDVVVSQEVIAHVPDQAGYLEQAARALKPGGHLILTTPNRYVHERTDWPPRPPGHIEHWLYRKDLLALLRPRFRVLRTTTAVPLGNRGMLRLVNSAKLTRLLGLLLLSGKRAEALKEWLGYGWTQVVLAQKRV